MERHKNPSEAIIDSQSVKSAAMVSQDVGFGSGIMLLRNSYSARVRLLGYTLLMLLSGCCLFLIHSLCSESFFTICPTFQTPSKWEV